MNSKQVHLLVEEMEQAQWQRRREQTLRRKVLESQVGEWRWQVQEDGRGGGGGRQRTVTAEKQWIGSRRYTMQEQWTKNYDYDDKDRAGKAHSPCPARQLSRYSDANRPCFVVRISYTSNGGSSPTFLALFQRSNRVIPRLGP